MKDQTSQRGSSVQNPVANSSAGVPLVLVVDDDSLVRELGVRLLVRNGYQAHSAVDGSSGWDALLTRPYDLLITDQDMPNMCGLELLAKIQSAGMRLPVIMVTGSIPEEEFKGRPWLLPEVILQKPYSSSDFLNAVTGLISRSRSGISNDGPVQAST